MGEAEEYDDVHVVRNLMGEADEATKMLMMMKATMMLMSFNSNIQCYEIPFRSLIHYQLFLGQDLVDFG